MDPDPAPQHLCDPWVVLVYRVVKTRDNFSSTVCHYEELMKRMKTTSQDPGLFNRMYARQGYLYLHAKRTSNLKLGSEWSKYYCQYQVEENFSWQKNFITRQQEQA
jgi:hypothetical protein